MEELFKQVLLIIFAAAVGEAVIEFLFVPIIDCFTLPNEKRTVLFNWVSATLGIGIAFAFSQRVFELLGAPGNLVGVDEVLTGVLIGRGSNYVHGLLKRFFLTITEKLETIKMYRKM